MRRHAVVFGLGATIVVAATSLTTLVSNGAGTARAEQSVRTSKSQIMSSLALPMALPTTTAPQPPVAVQVAQPKVAVAAVGPLSAATSPPQPEEDWYNLEMSRWSLVGNCIIDHESRTSGGAVALNPSGASGWFQFMDATWANFRGYGKAMYAPTRIQWERFFQVWNEGRGSSNWRGDHCGYGS